MVYLIVGIDPGTTTAFAALGLLGDVIVVKSKRNLSRAGLLSELRRVGIPVIIASDRARAPRFVSDICSQLGAKLILPKDDLRVSEKKQLAGDIDVRDHEMDALAAARYAYKQFEDLFRRVERNTPENEWGDVKRKLVLDEASNIKTARQSEEVVLRQEKRLKKRTGENELAELKKENIVLRKKLQALELRPERTKIIRVGDKVAETRLMTIKHKEQEINELKKQISLLEAHIGIYAMGGVPVGDEIVIAGKRIRVDEDVIKGLNIQTKDGIQFIMRAELEKVATRKIVEDIMSEYRS